MSELPIKLDIEASAATFEVFEDFTQLYMGRKMWKTVDDLERYRRVVQESTPELIIETGTRWGGSAEWFHGEFGVDVITVDIQRSPGYDFSPGVTSILGSSIHDHIVEEVRSLINGRRTMVVLDSDHHAPHVTREIQAYGPMVSPGCYLVVEDAIADIAGAAVGVKCGQDIPRVGGPMKAIMSELVGNHLWTRDRDIEDMTPVSHHPAGWWRRLHDGGVVRDA